MDSNKLLALFEDLRKRNDEATAKLLWKFRLATDLKLFAMAYFPHYCRYNFNELHDDLFDSSSFMERAIRRARAAPRGYAKSTLEALIEPIHDVCYALEKFIVIFSNREDQAVAKLRDIRTEILTNNALVTDYGIGFPGRTPGESSFILECGDHQCLFEGYGSGTEVRGIRFGSSRPSKIVVDDGENSEEVLNEALRQKAHDWLMQVVSKLGDEFTNIKVIGTILHPQSVLADLMHNPAYDGKVYKAVISWAIRKDLWDQWEKIYTNLDDPSRGMKADDFYENNKEQMLRGTKVLWPEKEPYVYLMKELIETGKRAFFKEKQNEPIGGENTLFEKILYYRETNDGFYIEHINTLVPWSKLKDGKGRWLSAYGALDPASGQTKAQVGRLGDYSCLLTGMALPIPGREFKLRLFVHSDWTRRAGASKWIGEIFDHDDIYDYQKFGIEENMYRELLSPNIEAERKVRQKRTRAEIKVPIYEIHNVENKEKRIHTLEPKCTHGWILFNRGLSNVFMQQMESFPTPRGHDDGPDALEMLWGLVNGRYQTGGLTLNQGGR